MERAPLVSDPEIGDFSDESEEVGTPTYQQPKRNRVWRTAAAILVLGAVAGMVTMGPIDNPMHADMGDDFIQHWSLSGAWDAVKAKGSEAVDYAKGKASEHLGHMKAFLAENLSPETQAYWKEKIAAIKAAPKWAQEQAQKMFCGMKTKLASFKARLAEKMKNDFVNKSTACGKDFRSQACQTECVADACQHVPTMSAGGGDSTGFNLQDIFNGPKNLCEVSMAEVMKHIVDNLAKNPDVIKGQQEIGSDTLLRTSIDLQMGEVDKEFNKVCSN